MKKPNNANENFIQQLGLIILRIIIGWHFLYEGIVKLLDTNWSAESYLANTRGMFSGVFHYMASQTSILEIVNFLNIWGLILIGLGLILGILSRLATWSGILLLFFYYIAYPPFQGYNYWAPQEGHYLLINKTFIELVALIVLALFPKSLDTGLQNLLKKIKLPIIVTQRIKKNNPKLAEINGGEAGSRREMLKHLAFIPFLGGFAWAFSNEKKDTGTDAFSGSTITLKQRKLTEIEGEMPMGVLVPGKKPISRLIMGTNHLSGNAHARDLKYASSLFKAYNTEKKIIETYMLAEQAGINLFFATPLLEQYKKMFWWQFSDMAECIPNKRRYLQ